MRSVTAALGSGRPGNPKFFAPSPRTLMCGELKRIVSRNF